jgi:succinate dehydrogenase/fumarate reductase flavoprotein subunit
MMKDDMAHMKTKSGLMKADVLVVGGGISGLFAAIGAGESGCKVVIAEKADAARSGDAGAGNDHFTTYLNAGESWDTFDIFMEWYLRLADGMVNRKAAERNVSLLPEAVKLLEDMGVPMRNPQTGTYIRTPTFGQTSSYTINFDGRMMKPFMVKKCRELGVEIVNRVQIAKLVQHRGHLAGAVGFDVRSAEPVVFESGNIVLATGDATRLWRNPSGNPFNTWNSPFNTGTAFRLAFESGAELAHMEFPVVTLTPKGFSAAGLNAILSMGGHLLNAFGERYMKKYHSLSEGAPRWVIIDGTYREIIEGRGPCYFDCRHLSLDDMHHLKNHLLPVDKLTYKDFCVQKSVDIAADLLELQLSEMQMGGHTGKLFGIMVNEAYETSREGLFAAGVAATPAYALSGACSTGLLAGRQAASRASAKLKSIPPLSETNVESIASDVVTPLTRGKGFTWREVEDGVRQIMADYVGPTRTAAGLKTALKAFDTLAKMAEEIMAKDPHALLRSWETRDLLCTAKLVAQSALRREESRFGIAHFRADYPAKNDQFRGTVVLYRSGGKIASRFVPAEEISQQSNSPQRKIHPQKGSGE